MASNTHGIDKKQWKKWTGYPQVIFNRMWHGTGWILDTDENLKSLHMTRKQKRVLQFNICFEAAIVMKDAEIDRKAGILLNVK